MLTFPSKFLCEVEISLERRYRDTEKILLGRHTNRQTDRQTEPKYDIEEAKHRQPNSRNEISRHQSLESILFFIVCYKTQRQTLKKLHKMDVCVCICFVKHDSEKNEVGEFS